MGVYGVGGFTTNLTPSFIQQNHTGNKKQTKEIEKKQGAPPFSKSPARPTTLPTPGKYPNSRGHAWRGLGCVASGVCALRIGKAEDKAKHADDADAHQARQHRPHFTFIEADDAG